MVMITNLMTAKPRHIYMFIAFLQCVHEFETVTFCKFMSFIAPH